MICICGLILARFQGLKSCYIEERVIGERVERKYIEFALCHSLPYKRWKTVILCAMEGSLFGEFFNDYQLALLPWRLRSDCLVILVFHHPVEVSGVSEEWYRCRDMIAERGGCGFSICLEVIRVD